VERRTAGHAQTVNLSADSSAIAKTLHFFKGTSDQLD